MISIHSWTDVKESSNVERTDLINFPLEKPPSFGMGPTCKDYAKKKKRRTKCIQFGAIRFCTKGTLFHGPGAIEKDTRINGLSLNPDEGDAPDQSTCISPLLSVLVDVIESFIFVQWKMQNEEQERNNLKLF